MDTVPEDPLGGPEADSHEDVQAPVDLLAARLDLSVLVEDRRQRPVWSATRGPVDGTGTGVDLRDGRSRTDLQLALWLGAYRRAVQPTPDVVIS